MQIKLWLKRNGDPCSGVPVGLPLTTTIKGAESSSDSGYGLVDGIQRIDRHVGPT